MKSLSIHVGYIFWTICGKNKNDFPFGKIRRGQKNFWDFSMYQTFKKYKPEDMCRIWSHYGFTLSQKFDQSFCVWLSCQLLHTRQTAFKDKNFLVDISSSIPKKDSSIFSESQSSSSREKWIEELRYFQSIFHICIKDNFCPKNR